MNRYQNDCWQQNWATIIIYRAFSRQLFTWEVWILQEKRGMCFAIQPKELFPGKLSWSSSGDSVTCCHRSCDCAEGCAFRQLWPRTTQWRWAWAIKAQVCQTCSRYPSSLSLCYQVFIAATYATELNPPLVHLQLILCLIVRQTAERNLQEGQNLL